MYTHDGTQAQTHRTQIEQWHHTCAHADRHSIRKSGMWNTKQSKWDKRRHKPTGPDSLSNGVDEVRWKSLYVSVSLSVSALITQRAAQYSSLTFCFPLPRFVFFSIFNPAINHWSIDSHQENGKEVVFMCVCVHVPVYNTIHLRIEGLLLEYTTSFSEMLKF